MTYVPHRLHSWGERTGSSCRLGRLGGLHGHPHLQPSTSCREAYPARPVVSMRTTMPWLFSRMSILPVVAGRVCRGPARRPPKTLKPDDRASPSTAVLLETDVLSLRCAAPRAAGAPYRRMPVFAHACRHGAGALFRRISIRAGHLGRLPTIFQWTDTFRPWSAFLVMRTMRPSTKAYRKAAKATHPDLNAGDPKASRRFNHITTAIEILRDAKERAAYDQLLDRERQRRRLRQDHIAIVDTIAAAAVIVVRAAGYALTGPVFSTSTMASEVEDDATAGRDRGRTRDPARRTGRR
jgi:hypothetical protein